MASDLYKEARAKKRPGQRAVFQNDGANSMYMTQTKSSMPHYPLGCALLFLQRKAARSNARMTKSCINCVSSGLT